MLETAGFKFLGNSLVLVPFSVSLALWMWLGGAKRMAVLWLLLFSATLFIVAASKVAYMAWSFEIASIDFRGFSGHAMRSTAIFPVFFYLVLHDANQKLRFAGTACGLLFGAMMAISVSVYDSHSASESIAGFLVGALTSLGFIRLSVNLRKPVLTPSRLAVISCASAILLSGTLRMDDDPTSRWLEYVSNYLSGKPRDPARQNQGWPHAFAQPERAMSE